MEEFNARLFQDKQRAFDRALNYAKYADDLQNILQKVLKMLPKNDAETVETAIFYAETQYFERNNAIIYKYGAENG